MKKRFLMAALAALAMVFATSCEKDETEDSGNYPEDLAGHWIPASEEDSKDFFEVGATVNGTADIVAHIEESNILAFTGTLKYNPQTGKGTVSIDPSMLQLVPTLAISLQAKDKDLVTLSVSIDGTKMINNDFKRVPKPDPNTPDDGDTNGNNGGENGDNDRGDNDRTWPESPVGTYTSTDDNGLTWYTVIRAGSQTTAGQVYILEISNDETNGNYRGSMTYDATSGDISISVESLPEEKQSYSNLVSMTEVVMQFTTFDSFNILVRIMGVELISLDFTRSNAE